jgi:hypothetical protein
MHVGCSPLKLVIGQISEVDNKICSNLCDPKLGGELVVNLCFTGF